ncbi:MAG: nucleotidyltransferase domain-containing protein [Candidatus Kerfeldbacteria bacterium]
MDQYLEMIVGHIEERFHPVSIFLYGSRARGDQEEISDYEIGVLFSNDNPVTRTMLRELNPPANFLIYPFHYAQFLKHHIDSPFPQNIFFRDLRVSGKTLSGKSVIEKFTPPPIAVVDLVERINFDMAFSLAALFSFRTGYSRQAKNDFTKSCLFGVRCLTILQDNIFPKTYDEMHERSKSLPLRDFHDVVANAIAVRHGDALQEKFVFRNISLLNTIVREKIRGHFNRHGDSVVIQ